MQKKHVMAFVLCVLLSACDKPAGVQKLNELSQAATNAQGDNLNPIAAIKVVDEHLAGDKKIGAEDIKFETVAFDYQLPKAILSQCQAPDNPSTDTSPADPTSTVPANDCPIVDISLAKSTPNFIADEINAFITQDNNPKRLKFHRNLEELLQFAMSDKQRIAKKIIINRLPNHNNLVQVNVINHLTYHHQDKHAPTARPTKLATNYLIFDMDLASKITLADVLTVDVNAFFDDDMMIQALGDFVDNTPALADFSVSNKQLSKEFDTLKYGIVGVSYFDNKWYFDDKGLVIVYPSEYLRDLMSENSKHGDGQKGNHLSSQITLHLPFEQLIGKIREGYLPTPNENKTTN